MWCNYLGILTLQIWFVNHNSPVTVTFHLANPTGKALFWFAFTSFIYFIWVNLYGYYLLQFSFNTSLFPLFKVFHQNAFLFFWITEFFPFEDCPTFFLCWCTTIFICSNLVRTTWVSKEMWWLLNLFWKRMFHIVRTSWSVAIVMCTW